MSDSWRNGYDAWKTSGPPEELGEEEEAGREDARIRAENEAEDRAMEDYYERKYGDGRK